MSSAVNVLISTARIGDQLRRTFSNSIFVKVMKKNDGSAVVQFFRLLNMLTVGRCSGTLLFRHLTNSISHRLQFQKHINYEDYLFFQNLQHFMYV